jgi:hypothetical protein
MAAFLALLVDAVLVDAALVDAVLADAVPRVGNFLVSF